MKVLHVNTFDSGGGAARAAMRLHAGLRSYGVQSYFITMKNASDEEAVLAPLGKFRAANALVKRHVAARIASFQRTPTNNVIHSLGRFPSGLGRWINESGADVVNLHWVCAEALSNGEISKIELPTVWTMHDMWPFMGAEHYDDLDHSGRWRNRYTAENRPSTYKGPDLDRITWARKYRAWMKKRFHLVAPSHWLANCARDSALMGGQPCVVIHNPLNTESFAPVEQKHARRMLGLPTDKKLILFGALGATSDRRKGYDLLVDALKAFEQAYGGNGTEVVVFGGARSGEIPELGLKSHFLGTFHDELSLRVVYSAADVFVAPSRQDNLPNTVVEAAACGLPTVAFDIGGMADIVNCGETGVLAQPFDTLALAAGINRLLSGPIDREQIRAVAEAKFSLESTVPGYLNLYERACGRC